MTEKENAAENKFYKRKLAVAVFLTVTIIFVGIFIFRRLESWTYINAFYFTVITLTTIGYGDIVPKTEIGKIAASLFALIGVAIFLFCVGIIAENYFFKRMDKLDKAIDDSKKLNININRKIQFIEKMKLHKKKKEEEREKEK